MYYRGEALDFFNMIIAGKTPPLMKCRIVFSSKIDVEHLKAAVLTSAKVVPEIFSNYQPDHNRFSVDFQQVDDVVVEATSPYSPENYAFDFYQGTQLKIFIIHHDQYDVLQLFMSHLLTDSYGFKEYLYLLATCYNQANQSSDNNDRRLRPALAQIQKQFKRSKYRLTSIQKPVSLPSYAGISLKHTGSIMLASKQFQQVRQQARAADLGISELVLAAYAKALQVLTGKSAVTLPYPVNFRRFLPASAANDYHITNLTGQILLNIRTNPDQSFQGLVTNVHQQLNSKRSEAAFLYKTADLQWFNHTVPTQLLRRIATRDLIKMPLTYTNFGVIEQQKLQFHGLTINNCTFSGAFRATPDLEIAASTYAGTCTLSFNNVGSERDYQLGIKILENIQAQLLVWSQQPSQQSVSLNS